MTLEMFPKRAALNQGGKRLVAHVECYHVVGRFSASQCQQLVLGKEIVVWALKKPSRAV